MSFPFAYFLQRLPLCCWHVDAQFNEHDIHGLGCLFCSILSKVGAHACEMFSTCVWCQYMWLITLLNPSKPTSGLKVCYISRLVPVQHHSTALCLPSRICFILLAWWLLLAAQEPKPQHGVENRLSSAFRVTRFDQKAYRLWPETIDRLMHAGGTRGSYKVCMNSIYTCTLGDVESRIGREEGTQRRLKRDRDKENCLPERF